MPRFKEAPLDEKMLSSVEADRNRYLSALDLRDSSDPCVIRLKSGVYVMYCTQWMPSDQHVAYHLGIRMSVDGLHWSRTVDALPTHVGDHNTWAPAIVRRTDGLWILYYASQVNRPEEPFRMALKAGVATSPWGPFLNERTILDQPYPGFDVIDPAFFYDPKAENDQDSYYCLFGSGDAGISLMRLSPDLLHPDLTTLRLLLPPIRGDANFSLVEAASLLYSHGTYRLIVSGPNCWKEGQYWVNEYSSHNIAGPYVWTSSHLFPETMAMTSAGHHSFVTPPDAIPRPIHEGRTDILETYTHYILPKGLVDHPTTSPPLPLQRPLQRGLLGYSRRSETILLPNSRSPMFTV